jgi:hypothetical protein
MLIADSERIMDERTRRELFSAMAMQGILASQTAASQSERPDPGDVAQWARTYADVLIAELMRAQVAGGQ